MAIKKTLAQNHLSDLAMQGRGGDTELAHVNPQEKAMLKAMGGSGGINPNTGLREYFIDPFTALSVGMSAYSAWKGGSEASKQATAQAKLSQLQIDEAKKGLGALGKARSAKMDIAQEEFRTAAKSLGIEKTEAQQGLDTAIQKSGLVTSVGITEKKSSLWNRFQQSTKGLYGQLGKAMGGVEEWFEGETSRLQGIIKRAQMQKSAADKQAGSWYLGKNIFG